MGKSFKKIRLCSAGNFGDSTEKIPQWVKANGGTYSKDVDSSITHLVVTEAAFKKNIEIGNMPICHQLYIMRCMFGIFSNNLTNSSRSKTIEKYQDCVIRLAGGLVAVKDSSA
jgi:hypothetical protein